MKNVAAMAHHTEINKLFTTKQHSMRNESKNQRRLNVT